MVFRRAVQTVPCLTPPAPHSRPLRPAAAGRRPALRIPRPRQPGARRGAPRRAGGGPVGSEAPPQHCCADTLLTLVRKQLYYSWTVPIEEPERQLCCADTSLDLVSITRPARVCIEKSLDLSEVTRARAPAAGAVSRPRWGRAAGRPSPRCRPAARCTRPVRPPRHPPAPSRHQTHAESLPVTPLALDKVASNLSHKLFV
jgi:hypothetical protein